MKGPEKSNPVGPDPDGEGRTRAPEIEQDLYCQRCGYNLRGLTGDRCPECGETLDTVRAAEPQIPWVYRREIGRFRAFWQTVWLVMFRQRRFCDEMARPVSYPDAQRFRWATILHVYVPILVATILFYALAPSPPFRARLPGDRAPIELLNLAVSAVWPIAVLHLSLVMYLAAVTGVPSYFFHPRGLSIDMQNRAIALSYYACGALAISALPIVAGFSSYFIGLDNDWGMFLAVFAVTVPCGQLIAWLLDLMHICRRTMPQFGHRAVLVECLVPILWLMLTGLILFGIPAITAYIVAMVFTLR